MKDRRQIQSGAWEKIGVAEESLYRAKDHLESMRSKYADVKKKTVGWPQ